MADTLANRIMTRILTRAISLYPPQTRAWGEAVLAEAGSITEFSTALSWTVGGLMVALRAFFSRLFRRSAAKNEPALIGPPQVPPPLPWKLALVCLAISGGLLFVPELRQGLSVTFSSWRSELKLTDETALWEKIGREAESKGDDAAMAVAAMRLPDVEGARFDEAMRLAEHAVAKDPSLTWIYYFLAQRRVDSRFHGSPHPELAQRMQDWDPKNAVPYLVEADEIARAHYDDPQWRGRRSISFYFYAPIQQEEVARLRGRDPRWLELMDRAFEAPVYETYFDRRLDLDLQVMQRLDVMNPQRAMSAYFFNDPIPNLKNLHEYAALRVAQGEEAERAGQWENAASEYWIVAQFGQRMRLGGKTDLEAVIARGLQETSFKRLQPLLFKLGRTQEAQTLAYAAQLQHAENEETRTHNNSVTQRLFTFSLVSALLVYICAIVLEASVLLMAVVLFMFAVRRAPRFVRFSLTYAPLLLLLSCTGLLCAYHPYAEYYRSYLANPWARDHESVWNFLFLCNIPQEVHNQTSSAESVIYFWWGIIAAAGAIGIWLLSKAVWRTARHQHA